MKVAIIVLADDETHEGLGRVGTPRTCSCSPLVARCGHGIRSAATAR